MRALASVVLACLLAFSIGCGQSTPTTSPDKGTAPAAQAGDDVKALYTSACSGCHPVAKVESYAGDEAWKPIVDRMITKHNAKITPENAEKIVAYLDKTYPKKK